jgi:hypothetical protein
MIKRAQAPTLVPSLRRIRTGTAPAPAENPMRMIMDDPERRPYPVNIILVGVVVTLNLASVIISLAMQ